MHVHPMYDECILTSIYSIGGPRLLYTLNQVGLLPSSYVLPETLQIPIITSKISAEELKPNLQQIRQLYLGGKVPWSMKVDEVGIEGKPRYDNIRDNCVGLCYEHTCHFQEVDVKLHDLNTLSNIRIGLDTNQHHVAKLALFNSFTCCSSLLMPCIYLGGYERFII